MHRHIRRGVNLRDAKTHHSSVLLFCVKNTLKNKKKKVENIVKKSNKKSKK